jgi:hypothetical protein
VFGKIQAAAEQQKRARAFSSWRRCSRMNSCPNAVSHQEAECVTICLTNVLAQNIEPRTYVVGLPNGRGDTERGATRLAGDQSLGRNFRTCSFQQTGTAFA